MHRRRNVASQPPSEATAAKDDGNADKEKTPILVVSGVGAEGCNLPSPSGINTWGKPASQATIVLVYFALLGAATQGITGVLQHGLGTTSDSTALPLVLGAVYALLGSAHFVAPGEFENVVPLYGTWGIWYVPGSRSFHVVWTGVVETVGGLGMVLGAVAEALHHQHNYDYDHNYKYYTDCCALVLFVMTVLVTPANVFMFTHGAKLPKDSDPLPVAIHGVRMLLQALLLALLSRIGS
jgi:uncharacterized membrane protein